VWIRFENIRYLKKYTKCTTNNINIFGRSMVQTLARYKFLVIILFHLSRKLFIQYYNCFFPYPCQ